MRDNLNNIFDVFDTSFNTDEGRNIFKKLGADERMINYSNLFIKAGNPNINNFDFLKQFGTLYDLLIDLLNEKINILRAAKEQNEMINKIEELRNFALSEEKSVKEKN